MKKVLLLSVLSLVILLGCNSNSTNPVTQTVIWPLAVGNYWVIKINMFDSTGIVVQSKIDTLKVISDSLNNSEKVYKLKYVNDPIFSFSGDYACNRTNGFYQLNKINDSLMSTLLVKYPGNAGDTFYSDTSLIKIDSTNASTSVTAGNFNCYKYSNEQYNLFFWEKQVVYMSPGIGQILFEVYMGLDKNNYKIFMRMELLSYKLY